ncbi:MAG: hypothetical protein GWO21_07775, partial [Gammaproteobacteria bacterium]|nr:hypothetical protein [Gammaproteobacteria bacterium]
MRNGIERWLLAVFGPLIDTMVRRRVHPNALSTIGFLITMSSAFAYHSN